MTPLGHTGYSDSFESFQLNLHTSKNDVVRVTLAYSDTFLLSQGCLCKRVGPYSSHFCVLQGRWHFIKQFSRIYRGHVGVTWRPWRMLVRTVVLSVLSLFIHAALMDLRVQLSGQSQPTSFQNGSMDVGHNKGRVVNSRGLLNHENYVIFLMFMSQWSRAIEVDANATF